MPLSLVLHNLGEATETQVTDSIWFNRRYPSMPIPHLIHHLCCKLRNCRLPHSAVTPSDHRSAIKVPFYWATCCCNEKWRKVAIWIIRLVRFPSQCCSLQMVPMPVSSQYRDRRCRQGGNLSNTYLTHQNNKIKTIGLIGLHQQANMAALYHDSEFVWVCKLILNPLCFCLESLPRPP